MIQNWHKLKVEHVMTALGTCPDGLGTHEVDKRLKKYGQNKLVEKARLTSLQILANQFKSFLILILVVAAIVSLGIGFYTGEPESLIDALVIVVIVFINAILGFYQESRAEKALLALKHLAAPKAEVIRDGKRQTISSTELVPGDIVLLSIGSRIPADLRIFEQMNLSVDESTLTGESVPVVKLTEPISIENVPVNDLKNMAFMGTTVSRGRGKGIVVRTGMQTEMGKIAHMVQAAEQKETPLKKKMNALGKKLGIAILALCALIFFLEFYREQNFLEVFLIVVSLAVAAVPEGLPAILTVTLAMGVERMAEQKAIVRKLPAVETLGSTTVICSDKTGTLTKDEMTIREVYANRKLVTVTGSGFEPEGKFMVGSKQIKPEPQLERLLTAGVLCNDSALVHENGWRIAGDPTEGSLVVLAEKAGISPATLKKGHVRVAEIEFDSVRKRMTTVNAFKGGRIASMKGAPEIVLELCSRIEVNGKVVKLTHKERKAILAQNKKMASKALRVLALAYRPAPPVRKYTIENTETDMIFLGLVGMIDPPRKTAKRAIEVCKDAGIHVMMITGDQQITATAIAKELGIIDKRTRVLNSKEIDLLCDEALEEIVEEIAVCARVSPEHKVRILNALKSKGHIVAMTGDGVNDAPALKNADIGVAMGITGTDVTKEASDMTLEDDNFATIVSAVEEGRIIYSNILKFVRYLLSSNAGEIMLILLAALIGLPLPLIAVQILWVNLLTDGLPAVALGADQAEPGIMKKKPRSPRSRVIDRDMVLTILLAGIVLTIGTLGVFYYTLPSNFSALTGAARAGALDYSRTLAFATLVMFQLFNVYNCRSDINSMFREKANKYLTLSVALSLVLLAAVVYLPVLQKLFHTISISLLDWLLVFAVSFSITVVMEIKKLIHRFYLRRS